MIGCDNFDRIESRYIEYWNRENHDRPLLSIRCPAVKQIRLPEFHGTLEERWLDTEYVLKKTRADLENTYFAGEAFPAAFPNLGPDVFGAFFGAGLEFGESTSWATGHADSLHDLDLSRLDENNIWWKKMIEMTEAMASDAKGDYLVGITDIHPGMDGLVSLRGPEELCFDLYEEPELVESLTFQLFDRFTEVYSRLGGIIKKYQKGETNWMNVYHPEGWYVTSCDFMGMISEEMMKQFVLPELKLELKFLKNSIFHLDGVGALRHLDCLLSLPELKGVQWVYGAGQPGAAHWIDVIRRIQSAGKIVHIAASPEDIPALLEALPPEGILYDVGCSNPDEADALLKMAERARLKKLF